MLNMTTAEMKLVAGCAPLRSVFRCNRFHWDCDIHIYVYIYCIVPDVWCRSYISDLSQQKNMAKTLRSIHSMHALFEWTKHYAVYHRGRSSLDVVPQHVCRHGGCCVLSPFRARSHGMGLWIIGKHQRWQWSYHRSWFHYRLPR